jgi:hypothetical protein
MIPTHFGTVVRLGLDIITGDQHHRALLPTKERRMRVQVAEQIPRQQQRLRVWHQAEGDTFVAKRVENLLLLQRLPTYKNFASPRRTSASGRDSYRPSAPSHAAASLLRRRGSPLTAA